MSSASAAQQLLITLKWWIYVFALLSVCWTHGKQRFLLTTRSWANRGTPHFTAFCFMVLHRYYGVLWVFICLKNRKKRKGCDNPVLSKSVDPIFPRTSAHFESLSHFGNSQYFEVFHCYICDPMDCSMPGLPVHRQLPAFTQTHVHQVGDAIQPSHPLSSPSPLALNLSQHQGLSNESVLHVR